MITPERKLVIVHGFPGAGKTTQSKRLRHEYPDIGHVSIGEVWRGIMNGGIESEYGDLVTSQDITKKQSDNLTNRLLFEAIHKLDALQRIVLIDGYPRYETAIEPFFSMTEEQQCRIIGGICLELDIEESVSRTEERGARAGEEGYRAKGISDRDKYMNFYENTYLRTIPKLREIVELPSVDASRNPDEVYEDTEREINRLIDRMN